MIHTKTLCKAKARVMLLVAILATMLGGCCDSDLNGDLDGQWQLMSITRSDGTSMAPDQKYYLFAMHMAMLREPGRDGIPGNMTYDEKAGLITIDFPRKASLGAWGLPDSPCSVELTIESLSRNHLVMTVAADSTLLSLRKF